MNSLDPQPTKQTLMEEIARLFYSWQLSNDEILQQYSITLTQLRFYCLQYRKIYGEQHKPIKEKPIKPKRNIIPEETRQEIARLFYSKELSIEKILEKYLIKSRTLYAYSQRYKEIYYTTIESTKKITKEIEKEIAELFYEKKLSTEEILKKYSIKLGRLRSYCYRYTTIHGKPLKIIKEKPIKEKSIKEKPTYQLIKKIKEREKITLTNRQLEIARLFYSWQLSNDEILQQYSITLTQLRFYCLQYRKIYGEQRKPIKEKPIKKNKLSVDFRTKQKIIELYKQRNTPLKITKILNLPGEKVRYILYIYRKTLSPQEIKKINLRISPLTTEEQKQIIVLYFNEIKSIPNIAKQMNKKTTQISYLIRVYREQNMPLYLSNQERMAEFRKEKEKNLTNDALTELTKKQIIALCKTNKNMIPQIAMARKINMYELLSWLK